MVQSQARLRSKSSPASAVVALRRLCDAKACLREREVRRAGSVARRWDSAAAALRFCWEEVLARAWRARKRARRSVVVVVVVGRGGEAGFRGCGEVSKVSEGRALGGSWFSGASFDCS